MSETTIKDLGPEKHVFNTLLILLESKDQKFDCEWYNEQREIYDIDPLLDFIGEPEHFESLVEHGFIEESDDMYILTEQSEELFENQSNVDFDKEIVEFEEEIEEGEVSMGIDDERFRNGSVKIITDGEGQVGLKFKFRGRGMSHADGKIWFKQDSKIVEELKTIGPTD